MNYRIAALLAPEDLGASGTKTINIALGQAISAIEIRFRTTKVLYNMTAAAPANITKIELVDGATPLVSMTGYEAQALAYYNRPGRSMEHGQHIQTQSEVDMYLLDFGRHLWDPRFAFLPNRYKNPQLKITWDEDVADTSATVNECEVLAYVFDEKQPTPEGFLRGIEWYSYTMGAQNSFETIKLPEDHVIRQMLVRSYRDAFEPWVQHDQARFDENNLQRIPFEYTDLETYYRRMKATWHAIETPLIVEPTNAQRFFYVPATDYWATIVFTNVAANQDPYLAGTDMKGGKADIRATANAQAVAIARGYLPWHCWQFPMGLPDDPDDWYDPKGRSPRLRLRAGSSGTSGTGQVVLEQLVRY